MKWGRHQQPHWSNGQGKETIEKMINVNKTLAVMFQAGKDMTVKGKGCVAKSLNTGGKISRSSWHCTDTTPSWLDRLWEKAKPMPSLWTDWGPRKGSACHQVSYDPRNDMWKDFSVKVLWHTWLVPTGNEVVKEPRSQTVLISHNRYKDEQHIVSCFSKRQRHYNTISGSIYIGASRGGDNMGSRNGGDTKQSRLGDQHWRRLR